MLLIFEKIDFLISVYEYIYKYLMIRKIPIRFKPPDEQKMINLHVRRHHTHKVYKILTLQEDPARCIYINRDYNVDIGILNMGYPTCICS